MGDGGAAAVQAEPTDRRDRIGLEGDVIGAEALHRAGEGGEIGERPPQLDHLRARPGGRVEKDDRGGDPVGDPPEARGKRRRRVRDRAHEARALRRLPDAVEAGPGDAVVGGVEGGEIPGGGGRRFAEGEAELVCGGEEVFALLVGDLALGAGAVEALPEGVAVGGDRRQILGVEVAEGRRRVGHHQDRVGRGGVPAVHEAREGGAGVGEIIAEGDEEVFRGGPRRLAVEDGAEGDPLLVLRLVAHRVEGVGVGHVGGEDRVGGVGGALPAEGVGEGVGAGAGLADRADPPEEKAGDAELVQQDRQGGGVAEGVGLPAGARLDAEGRADPGRAALPVLPLDRRRGEAGVLLRQTAPGEGDLAGADEGVQLLPPLGVGLPEVPDERDLLQGVAKARVLPGDVDRGGDVAVRLEAVGIVRVVPVGIPVREGDDEGDAPRPGDQSLRVGVEGGRRGRGDPGGGGGLDRHGGSGGDGRGDCGRAGGEEEGDAEQGEEGAVVWSRAGVRHRSAPRVKVRWLRGRDRSDERSTLRGGDSDLRRGLPDGSARGAVDGAAGGATWLARLAERHRQASRGATWTMGEVY